MRHTLGDAGSGRDCREIIAYFYERKCRAAVASGPPTFLRANPIVLHSQRRGPSVADNAAAAAAAAAADGR